MLRSELSLQERAETTVLTQRSIFRPNRRKAALDSFPTGSPHDLQTSCTLGMLDQRNQAEATCSENAVCQPETLRPDIQSHIPCKLRRKRTARSQPFTLDAQLTSQVHLVSLAPHARPITRLSWPSYLA